MWHLVHHVLIVFSKTSNRVDNWVKERDHIRVPGGLKKILQKTVRPNGNIKSRTTPIRASSIISCKYDGYGKLLFEVIWQEVTFSLSIISP